MLLKVKETMSNTNIKTKQQQNKQNQTNEQKKPPQQQQKPNHGNGKASSRELQLF